MNRAHARVFAVLLVVLLAESAHTQAVIHESAGSQPDDFHGLAVAGLRDLTGDGVSDYAVGEPGDSAFRGRLEVRSGASGALVFVRTGSGLQHWYGHAVCGVGDLDGDAREDIAVGAPHPGDFNRGYVEILSGANGTVLRHYDGVHLDGWYGSALALVGDVDGDQVGDLMIGERAGDRAEIRSGANGLLLREFLGTSGPGLVEYFGEDVTGLGDVDQDGFPDVAIGALHEDGPGGQWAGAVHVFSGATGLPIHVVYGTLPFDFVGQSVARIGDVDLDGADDFVTGARLNDSATGRALVCSGRTGALLRTISGLSPGDVFGTEVAAVGDRDGDGLVDFAAMGVRAGPGCNFAGHVDVLSARTGALLLIVPGPTPNADFGLAIDTLGDLDGDGIDEWIVAAPVDDVAASNAGRVRVYQGQPPQVIAEACIGDGSGTACPCANASAPGLRQGCAHSGLRGTRLTPRGLARVGADSLVLDAAYLPLGATAIFVQGAVALGGGSGVTFGDGLRCVGGTVTRLGSISTACGQAAFPSSPGAQLSTLGGAVAGQTLHYQVRYRNLAGPCGSGFNLSSALSITWQP